MKTALLVGAIVIGGAGAGFAAERAGLLSPLGEPTVIATLDAVPYSVCPAEQSIGDLHRGDRVLVTGRSADGDWVEIRAPYDLRSRVWVESALLIPDSSLEALPGVDCELSEFDAAGEPVGGTSTTTTSAPAASNSSSSAAASSSSTSSTLSSSSSALPPSTSSTSSSSSAPLPPADQEGPVVVFLQSTEGDLWEDAQYGGCPTQEQTAVVSAIVADPSGIASVQLSWSVTSSNGTLEMLDAGSDAYSVTIGPYAESTLSLNGGSEPIFVTLTAVDLFGNPTAVSSNSLVILHDCAIP